MTPRIWAFAILGAAIVGALAASYVKGRADGRKVEIAERATLEEVARVAREEASQAAADAIAAQKVQRVTIRQETEREIIREPLPADCVASDRLLELTNAAITGHYHPADSGELPGADADDGKDDGGLRP